MLYLTVSNAVEIADLRKKDYEEYIYIYIYMAPQEQKMAPGGSKLIKKSMMY